MQAFEWHRRFREGREIKSQREDKRSGCPQTSHTTENIDKFSAVVQTKLTANASEEQERDQNLHFYEYPRTLFYYECKLKSTRLHL
ncbi:hypothetical protein TNCV_4060361 [Trichonephila clavipes]|nr:hypothetical protein TNCV_4060361 [Trichonephila clavipes]